jgi:hypothetical protein
MRGGGGTDMAMNYQDSEVGKPKVTTFATLISQMADTTYGMTAADYARFLVRIGFEPLVDDAVGSERFHIYGRETGGIILTFDTFHKQRNCASVQFRTRSPQYLLPPDSVIEEITDLDAKTVHVRLDARQGLLASLDLFEETSPFIGIWGNLKAPADICGLALEQDAAVALREGVSPRDISARMKEVSRRRCDLLPSTWKERLDIGATRNSADARALAALS